MKGFLDRDFEEDEVERALKQMLAFKSPVWFGAGFYKNHWGIV